MSQFRTLVLDRDFSPKINFEDKLFSLGSCFAEHIGKKMSDHQMDLVYNPLGIAYNPVSISKQLHYILHPDSFPMEDWFEKEGRCFHYDVHSKYNYTTRSEAKTHFQKVLEDAQEKLLSSQHLIITLGTAQVFQLAKNSQIVSNCHRQNSSLFSSRMLSIAEIIESIGRAFSALKAYNPNVQLLLTVSPIRHQRIGLEDNQWSKSILRCAIQLLMQSQTSVQYFPSYEIMMDDLRDYRFYQSDMLHPSEEAIDYIWSYFSKNVLSNSCQDILKTISKLNQELNHRALYPGSETHLVFLQKLISKIETVQNKYGKHIYKLELEKCENQLASFSR